MNNQEIDDFLAEKVMGWKVGGDSYYWHEGKRVPGLCGHQMHWSDWQPATDLNQAVQAAEKIGEQLHTHIVLTVFPGDYSAKLVSQTWVISSTIGPADALARAVVKAAGGTDA